MVAYSNFRDIDKCCLQLMQNVLIKSSFTIFTILDKTIIFSKCCNFYVFYSSVSCINQDNRDLTEKIMIYQDKIFHRFSFMLEASILDHLGLVQWRCEMQEDRLMQANHFSRMVRCYHKKVWRNKLIIYI